MISDFKTIDSTMCTTCLTFEAFVSLVLCLSFLPAAYLDTKHYDIVEIFAGAARISRGARVLGRRSCAVDLEYEGKGGCKRGCMDITTDAGFA